MRICCVEKDKLINKNNINYFGIRIKKYGGRNNSGKIMVRHSGGGYRKKLYNIDFVRRFKSGWLYFLRTERDARRTARIALAYSCFGFFYYILAPEKLELGKRIRNIDLLKRTEKKTLHMLRPGHHIELHEIPLGSFVHNIELKPGNGSKLLRAAGMRARLTDRKMIKSRVVYVGLVLPSGRKIYLSANCSASYGQASNSEHHILKLKKAGQARIHGKRPVVRGEAMNPIDHPHGGRTRGGKPPVNLWGRLAHGVKTRKANNEKKYKYRINRINKLR